MGQTKPSVPYWVVIFWLGLWQLGSVAVGHSILFPSPLDTAQALLKLIQKQEVWQSIAVTLCRISVGFLSGSLVAVLLSLLSQRLHWCRQLLSPVMLLGKSVPVACFVILILIWFDSSTLSVMIAFLMVLPIQYSQMLTALGELDQKQKEMAEVFQLPPLVRLRYISLPQLFPYALSASKLSLGLSFKAGIAAELIGLPKHSIGEHLYASKLYLATSELFAWTVIIVILSILYEHILQFLLIKSYETLTSLR